MAYKIPDYEYLDVIHNRDLEGDIYEGETSEHFNINEFEAKTRDIDWVSLGIVKNSIDLILDLTKVSSIQAQFTNDQQTDYFNSLLENGFNLVLEKAIRDLKVFGDGYIQLAVEDNMYTNKEDFSLRAYNIDPCNVYADYDTYNPQRGAKKYTIPFEKTIEKTAYLLLITFMPNAVVYQSYEKKGREWVEIDTKDIFGDVLSESLDYQRQGLAYLYITNTDYSILTHFSNGSEYGEFYGQSDITTGVVSKLQALERMYNLSDLANTNNANPKLALSKATGKLLKQAIEEVVGANNSERVAELPENFTSSPISSKSSVSYQFSQVAQRMGQKLVYFEDDGQGETKYITNPFKLADLYELVDRLKEELYNDLHISQLLINPDISLGNASGVAINRLLTKTIEHIKTLRDKITPKIQQFAFTCLEFSKNSNLEDANYPEPTELPVIIWEDITNETIQDIVTKYGKVIDVYPTEELRLEFVSKLIGKDISEIQQMPLEEKPANEDTNNMQNVQRQNSNSR